MLGIGGCTKAFIPFEHLTIAATDPSGTVQTQLRKRSEKSMPSPAESSDRGTEAGYQGPASSRGQLLQAGYKAALTGGTVLCSLLSAASPSLTTGLRGSRPKEPSLNSSVVCATVLHPFA